MDKKINIIKIDSKKNPLPMIIKIHPEIQNKIKNRTHLS